MSILKRKVFYDDSRGNIMFWDWAMVTTTLGSMVEPFIVGQKYAINDDILDFDPADEINRIDSIRIMDLNKEQVVLSTDPHLHGGSTIPSTGR
ncbi:hypothetical protein LCGC14_1179430 [marine sediment metagenome]|uniref:Uncharacterized protein n=1 Tax=marine sediment metagenome TaxID=412755 RepID=A0A0F9PT53_9ZZZZ